MYVSLSSVVHSPSISLHICCVLMIVITSCMRSIASFLSILLTCPSSLSKSEPICRTVFDCFVHGTVCSICIMYSSVCPSLTSPFVYAVGTFPVLPFLLLCHYSSPPYLFSVINFFLALLDFVDLACDYIYSAISIVLAVVRSDDSACSQHLIFRRAIIAVAL